MNIYVWKCYVSARATLAIEQLQNQEKEIWKKSPQCCLNTQNRLLQLHFSKWMQNKQHVFQMLPKMLLMKHANLSFTLCWQHMLAVLGSQTWSNQFAKTAHDQIDLQKLDHNLFKLPSTLQVFIWVEQKWVASPAKATN